MTSFSPSCHTDSPDVTANLLAYVHHCIRAYGTTRSVRLSCAVCVSPPGRRRRRVRCSGRASVRRGVGRPCRTVVSLGGGVPCSRPFSWSLRGLYVVHDSRFRGLNVVYGMNGIVLWCTFLHFHLLPLPAQIRRNPRPVRVWGLHSVEPPGIEPGSFTTAPGLLRAQFAQNLCSALRIRRTCPNDGPSQ